MSNLPPDKSLRRWLEQYSIPPVPDERVLDLYRLPLSDDPNQGDPTFGGDSSEEFNCVNTFEEACGIMGNYLEFLDDYKTALHQENGKVVSRLRPTREAMHKCKQLLAQFPFCAEAYRTMGIIFKEEGVMCKAIQAFQYCLECYKLTDPDLVEQRRETDWGYMDQRPYFRSLHSYADCLNLSGDYSLAIDVYQALLELIPNDNMGVRYLLFYLLIKKGDYDDAKNLAKERNMQDEVPYLTGMILMNFVEYNKGNLSEDEMKITVVNALEENPFVVLYTNLAMDKRLPPQPSYYTMHGKSQALSIAYEFRDMWHKIDGLSRWIESTMCEGGFKPENGKDMFDLLNKGNILIMTKSDKDVVVTTDVSIMRGRGSSDFKVPKGTKQYNEATGEILMYVNGVNDDKDKNWISLKLDDIIQVPFWKSILMHGSCNDICGECCERGAKRICGACKAIKYCNRECQKQHWRAGHRNNCKRFTKT